MSTLDIRKKSLKTWLHTDSVLGNFIISKFYFNADGLNFQIVEQGQSKRVIYNINDISLYDDTNGGAKETFTTILALSLRLEELSYPAFFIDGQITSISNLIEAGDNVTITGDGTSESPYVINSTGGGGGSTNLQEVTDNGNETTNDIKVKDSENRTRIFYRGIAYEDLDDGGTTILSFMNTSNTNEEILIRGISGTMALLSDIPSVTIPTLQEVLTEGSNAIDESIIITNTGGTAEISLNKYSDGSIRIEDATNDANSTIGASQFVLSNNDGSDTTFYFIDKIQRNTNQFLLPSSSGTLALTSDIPTGGGGIPHATASGTDTYTASVTGVTSYADGDAYLVRFTNGNTTSCTLNINSLGAIPLYRNNDGALIGGDIVDGAEMLCIYNSLLNEFQVIGTAPNSLFSYITNADSVTLTKGMPVYAFGGTGDRMTVKRASNSADATSAQTVGLVLSASIAVGQKGLIIMQGLLDGLSTLPTSTFSDGDAIYLGATAGTITNVKPYAPNHLVYLGVVTTASNGSAGRMYVRVQNGYELDELHNVQAQSPSLKDTLWYDNTVSPAQWKTASISTILGYTPVTNARTLTINGTALDLSTDRSWSVGTVTSVAALTLGTSGTDLSSSVATGTTTPVITLNVPTASATNRGVLSSTDWTTFNNKQASLGFTPYKYLNTTQTSVTGTLSETIVATATINGNTFNSNDIMKILFKVTKGTTLAAQNIRIRINTSNTLSGATTVGVYTTTTATTYHLMQRNFDLSGGTLYGYNFNSSLISDITAVNTTGISTSYNTANTLYVFFTIQLGNTGDTVTFNMASITN